MPAADRVGPELSRAFTWKTYGNSDKARNTEEAESKLEKALTALYFTTDFLEVLPAVQSGGALANAVFAAGSVAALGYTATGSAQLLDGIRGRDLIEALDGASKVSYGVSKGIFEASNLLGPRDAQVTGPGGGAAQSAATGLGVLGSAVWMSVGALEIRNGLKDSDRFTTIVGITDLALGGMEMAAWLGVMPVPLSAATVVGFVARELWAKEKGILGSLKGEETVGK